MVLVLENLVSEKIIGFALGDLVSEKSIGFCFGLEKKSRFRKKSLDIGFDQNFGTVIQCLEVLNK